MTTLVNDLPAINVQNLPDWKKSDLAAVEQVRKDFAPFAELEVCADMEGDNPRYFFARFVHNTNIYVKKERSGYYIITDYTQFDTDAKYENNPPPNNFKVITPKKVADWLIYYAHRAMYLNEAVRLKNEKIAAFTAEFEKSGGKLESGINGTLSGEIVKNGVQYSVIIMQPSGYIDQKVSLYYKVPNNLSAFLALSDNAFTPSVTRRF